jgi:hypothetical protein
MTPLQEKLQAIQDQGIKKIAALFRIICQATEQLKQKLSSTREEKKEAREELQTFLDLLKDELQQLQKKTGLTSKEILKQVVDSSEFTETERENIAQLNQLIVYCKETSFKSSSTEKRDKKNIKG